MFSLTLLLFILTTEVISAKLPNYITRCKLDDTERFECARKAAQNALNFIVKGDDQYNLPNLLPYKLPKIELISGNNLKMMFKNCLVSGLENVHFSYVDFDLDKHHVKCEGTLDKINMLSDYDINGRILVIPISGSGPSNITFVGIKFSHHLNYDLFDKNGKTYINVTGSQLSFIADRSYYKLDNLFNGDKVLGAQMNKFLDENWDAVGNDINPALTEIINDLITKTVKQIITHVPYNDIYL